jgi:hypothetical protein
VVGTSVASGWVATDVAVGTVAGFASAGTVVASDELAADSLLVLSPHATNRTAAARQTPATLLNGISLT